VTEVTRKDEPPDLVKASNTLFESRIPAIHRLGIRIVELREDFVAGTAPLGGNLNYQSSMYAGTLFGLGEASAQVCSPPILTCSVSPQR
jgi:hypothetical protein